MAKNLMAKNLIRYKSVEKDSPTPTKHVSISMSVSRIFQKSSVRVISVVVMVHSAQIMSVDLPVFADMGLKWTVA